MPSDRKQFNVRMSDETAAKVERLIPVVNAAVGIELSQSQFFALAVAALQEKYPVTSPAPAGSMPAPTAAKKPKGKKDKT